CERHCRRQHSRARGEAKRNLQSRLRAGALIQRTGRRAQQMSRDKISARLHREPARPLPKLHPSGFGESPGRARLSAAVLARKRRGRLRDVALPGSQVAAYPSQKNFVGRLISGGRLLCTGQLSAVCSRISRCGESGGNGICTSLGNPTIRRGGSWDISFCTETVMPRRLTPSSSALIPMVVLMHVASAVATRSVGENASPLPLLSVGASVEIFDCDGPCVASQCRSPVYLTPTLTINSATD